MQYTPLDESSEEFPNAKPECNGSNGDVAARNTFRRKGTTQSDLSEPLTDSDVEAAQQQQQQIKADADDPFFVFREDLQKKLELVDDSLAQYLRVVHHTDTAVNTHECKDTKKQLKRHIKNAESTLRDVQTTVQLVESKREKFARIDNAELQERKGFVQSSQDRLLRAKQDMHSESVKAKMQADERAKAFRRNGGDPLLGAKNEVEKENTAFIVDSQVRTSLLMQQQDETLDELGDAVVRVGQMADGMHEEIGTQAKILNQIEEDLENAEEQLGMVMGKLAKLLKTKSKWQLGTILALTLAVIVLLFLVIYT